MVSPAFTSGIVALYPKGNALSRIKQVSLRDLVGYGLIVLPQNSETRSAIEKVFWNHGFEMKKVLEAEGCSVIREYVELRLGVGLVHEICVRGKRGSFSMTDVKRLFPQYDVVLIYRNDRRSDPCKKGYRVAFSRGLGVSISSLRKIVTVRFFGNSPRLSFNISNFCSGVKFPPRFLRFPLLFHVVLSSERPTFLLTQFLSYK